MGNGGGCKQISDSSFANRRTFSSVNSGLSCCCVIDGPLLDGQTPESISRSNNSGSGNIDTPTDRITLHFTGWQPVDFPYFSTGSATPVKVLVMQFFVLQKNGRTSTKGNCLFRNAEGQLCVWQIEDNAQVHAEKRKTSWETWRVRPATSEDFKSVGQQQKKKTYLPVYHVMDQEKTVAKKTTSTGCLVDVFEDFERRKFAISSKAATESEFLVEVSTALSEVTGSVDWNVRLRETLPLIVDLCCKYRGYKADTVFERRELVAGDLEMPKSA